MVVLTVKGSLLLDGSFIVFKQNSCVLLKKRLSTKGKEILGPGLKKIKRKKFLISFSGII